MAIIQVWSAPSCEAGAICYGALAPWISASGSEATGTPAGFRMTVTRDVADAASLDDGRCLRVLSQSRGEQWWFVSQVADSDGDAGLVTVTAGPLRQLLTVRGLVRDGETFAFAADRLTPEDTVTERVLTNLSDDGLSWLTLGTIDYTDPVALPAFDRVTRAEIVTAVERETGYTAQLRAVYSGSTLTGFALDLLADAGASLDTVPLAVGAQVSTLQRTRDALRAATVVLPFDVDGTAMRATTWVIDSVTGTGPAWLALRDVESGQPWPIRIDDQLVGAYLVEADGTATAITDSRASDSAVQVATLGTLSAGDEVTIARLSTGEPVLELTNPAAIAGPRGRLVAKASTTEPHGERNLAPNPLLLDWSAINNPDGWSSVNGPIVGEYLRDAALTWTAVADGAQSAGASVVLYRGATAGAPKYQSENVNIVTVSGTVNFQSTTTVPNGSGTGSVFVDPVLTANVADGAAITMSPVNRPDTSAWPSERYQNSVMRFLTNHTTTRAGLVGQGHMRSPAVRVFPVNGATVRARSAWTFRNTDGSAVQNLNGGGSPTSVVADMQTFNTPGMFVYNDSTSAILGVSASTGIAATSTVNETMDLSFTLASATTLRIGLFPGNGTKISLFAACRWVTLWQGDDVPAEPWIGSRSNRLWHRAQDVLATLAQGTRYVVRGVDLTRLQQEHGALALGQSVQLGSDILDAPVTVRIVKLDYDFTGPEVLNLELGAITPRLTGVTVSL